MKTRIVSIVVEDAEKSELLCGLIVDVVELIFDAMGFEYNAKTFLLDENENEDEFEEKWLNS